jgi:hypothetical protein
MVCSDLGLDSIGEGVLEFFDDVSVIRTLFEYFEVLLTLEDVPSAVLFFVVLGGEQGIGGKQEELGHGGLYEELVDLVEVIHI